MQGPKTGSQNSDRTSVPRTLARVISSRASAHSRFPHQETSVTPDETASVTSPGVFDTRIFFRMFSDALSFSSCAWDSSRFFRPYTRESAGIGTFLPRRVTAVTCRESRSRGPISSLTGTPLISQ